MRNIYKSLFLKKIMKKGWVIFGIIVFVIIVVGLIFYSKQQEGDIPISKDKNCFSEGQIISSMPLPPGLERNDTTSAVCCAGLKEYSAMDISVCGNCGDGICKTYGDEITSFNESSELYCPEDCD
jgi:hypothetical protein